MKKQIIIPRHVALIMDGNRRWAEKKGLPKFEGHKKGEDGIEPIVDASIDLGIEYLTFWVFSTENWNRSKREVSFLMRLYRKNLNKKLDSFHRKNVRVKVIGNITMFPDDIIKKTREWMDKTKNNKRITVNLALSYGGRDEIIRAVNKWQTNQKSANINQQLTKKDFEKFLDTAGQSDPDLLIRTGGERRLSGFLLWQLEYTELYFTSTLWPDFTPRKFRQAITEYQKRQRRYGK